MLSFKTKNSKLTLNFKEHSVISEDNTWFTEPVTLLEQLQNKLIPRVKRPRGSIYKGKNMGFLLFTDEEYNNIPFEQRKGEIRSKLFKQGGKFRPESVEELNGKIIDVDDNGTSFTLFIERSDKVVVAVPLKRIVLEWFNN